MNQRCERLDGGFVIQADFHVKWSSFLIFISRRAVLSFPN